MAGCTLLAVSLGACTPPPKTLISGHINTLSQGLLVAVLPAQATGNDQGQAARLFRKTLYAHLTQARLKLMEPSLVDALLIKHGLTDPRQYAKIGPIRLGEILGADAVVLSRVDRMERSYFILHSAIEIGMSVELIDTRSGEILWKARQSESDFEGLAKLPTGIAAAIWAPVQFVTNKLSLQRLTRKMVDRLTRLVKRPGQARPEEKFAQPQIASAAVRDLKRWSKKTRKNAARRRAVHSLARKMPGGLAAKTVPNAGPPWPGQTMARVHIQPAMAPGLKLAALPGAPIPLPTVQTEPPGKPVVSIIPLRAVILHPGPRHPLPAAVFALRPAPDASHDRAYTLQVGAFKNRANADRLVRRLRKSGHAPVVHALRQDGRPLYRVHMSRYHTLQEARQASRSLKTLTGLTNFVTRIRNQG